MTISQDWSQTGLGLNLPLTCCVTVGKYLHFLWASHLCNEDGHFYGLNVLYPSKIYMLKSNLQCDDIWRWGHWEVIRP